MKEIQEGKIKRLMPEGEGGGLTGETHILEYKNKKYVLRICTTLSKAKFYEETSKKFQRYSFLPRLIKREGKNVLYEDIPGRDLTNKKEKLKNIEQIGKILATINKKKFEGGFSDSVPTKLKEIGSGKYKPTLKVKIARETRNIKAKPKRLLNKKQTTELLDYYKNLKSKVNPKLSYDCGDPTPGNFRVNKGKVYLVDIDSIKKIYKGYGISKFFKEWGKTPAKAEAFRQGYGKEKIKFYDKDYKNFIDFIFLIQKLNFSAQTGKDTKPTLEKLLSFIK